MQSEKLGFFGAGVPLPITPPLNGASQRVISADLDGNAATLFYQPENFTSVGVSRSIAARLLSDAKVVLVPTQLDAG